jgi:hypothetical protein
MRRWIFEWQGVYRLDLMHGPQQNHDWEWGSLPVLLELIEVKREADNVFAGRHGPYAVRLSKHRAGIRIEVALKSAAPFERVRAKDTELRMDDVESGDADFDASIRVTANDWNRHGTRELLVNPSIRRLLRELVDSGGEVLSESTCVTLHSASLRSLKSALQVHVALAEALASLSATRQDAPVNTSTEPTFKPHRIHESSGSYVEERAPGRFHFHNPGFAATCFELDVTARTLQAVPGAFPAPPIPLSELTGLFLAKSWLRHSFLETIYELEVWTRSGRKFTLCRGSRDELESLANRLSGYGMPVDPKAFSSRR